MLTGIRDTGIALGKQHRLTNSYSADWIDQPAPLLTPLIEEFFRGNVNEDAYIAEVLKEYPQLGPAEWLKQHIRENFREVEGTRETLLELRRLDYRLALLSIHAREWIEYCEQKFGFHKLFDVRLYSYETKVPKPHPTSFEMVLQELGAKPEECLFIDDAEVNTKAAEALGIRSIVFTSAPNLRRELQGILPDFK